MIRHLIVSYGHFGLLFLLILYVLTKSLYISKYGLWKHFSEIFFMSLIPVSKQGLKNTFQEKTKKYYKKSNVINYVYYIAFLVAIAIYSMMHSLS
jgi:hypothetical protein